MEKQTLLERLGGTTWMLEQNPDGLAAGDTRLTFERGTEVLTGRYEGPNVASGQLLLRQTGAGATMLYHASAATGDLVAGEARVRLVDETLRLTWRWLTGPGSGVSVWREPERSTRGSEALGSEALIVALDVGSLDEMRLLVDVLGDDVLWYKVGLSLLTAAGTEAVRYLTLRGKRVFLDLKLHEIADSAASAVRRARDLGVAAVSVHASGGRTMLEACAHAADDAVSVLAVTVVTALDDDELAAIGFAGSAGVLTMRLASLAVLAGVDGVLASPLEAARLRERLGPDVRIVTPGVRPVRASTDAHRRTATPAAAIANGADQIIVGRPVIAATDPAAAVQSILDSIRSGA